MVAAVVLAAALSAGAAAASQDGGTGVRVLYAGGQCGGGSPGAQATVLEGAHELRGFFSRQGRLQLGPRPEAPSVDFASELVVLLEQGARPTGGYGLALGERGLRVRRKVANVAVRWDEPAPDASVTQATSSPCLLLAVPRGGFRRLRVLDQRGDVRFDLRVP